jgi:excisionase family DNA binding protein
MTTTERPGTRSRGRAHSYADVAQILGISEREVIRKVRSGELKADKLSARVVRIFDDSLDAFVERQREVA